MVAAPLPRFRRNRLAIAAAAALALAATGCSAERAVGDASQLSAQANASAVETGKVTSILNAGVMAQIGASAAPVKFLFDPIYDEHFGSLEPLSDTLIDAIVTGAAPYDGVSAVFVSHAHGDHFSARHFNRLMAAQPAIRLVAPQQAVEMMRGEAGWQDGFAARITAITLENGAQAPAFTLGAARIEAFRSPHAGWPDRHANVHNITYRVTAASGPDGTHRVMHLGDAAPQAQFFAPHAEFLSSARTGVAVVPFWFLNAGDAEALVGETLNAEAGVGMHVPVNEPDWLAGSGWDYFNGAGQDVAVPATE